MRKWVLIIAAVLGLYLVAPYWSAWRLYEALKARDAPALADRVDWSSLRANLKASLLERLRRSGDRVTLGLGGKDHVGQLSFSLTPQSVDTLVNRYASPEGLADFLMLEGLLKAPKSPAPAPPPEITPSQPDAAPGRRRRLAWAFFSSPTSFEIQVETPGQSGEVVVPVLELQRWGWMLTDIRFRPRT